MTCRDWPWIRLLFSNVPGPLIAKVTRLWRLYHLLRGDCGAAVKRLHDRHGPLVQIAPHEYSLGDKSLVYIPNLQRTCSIVLPSCQYALDQSLRMANLYSAERHVDSCNVSLFALLQTASHKGENIDVRELLTRYAHEIMLACTIGQRAGLLERDTTGHHLDIGILKKWKFYAILHGSYLRYHPYIASIVKRWHVFGGSSIDLMLKLMPSTLLQVLGAPVSSHKSEVQTSDAELEACVALTLAATDPTINLIMTALYYIYSTPGLLEQLRAEIFAARSSPRPTFKELILARPNLSKLNAVLLECARLHPNNATGPAYSTSNGEIDGTQKVPPGSTITLEPSMIHLDPSRFGDDSNTFNPMRWLDEALAPELQRTLLAYNIGDIDNIETTQLLMAAKLLIPFMGLCDFFRLPAHLNNCKQACILGFRFAQGILPAFFRLKIAPSEAASVNTSLAEAPTTCACDDSSKDDCEATTPYDHAATAPANNDAFVSHAPAVQDITTVSDADFAPDDHNTILSALELAPKDSAPVASSDDAVLITTATAPDASADDDTPVATSPSNVEKVSSDASTSTTTTTRLRGSGSSIASSSTAGDRTIVTLPAANQLTSILGEADAKELLTGRFAPSQKNFLGAKAIYTKPIPDAYLRRLVHKALDETHGQRLAHINNPDTNIMAIGLRNSIPRSHGGMKQQADRPNHYNRRYQNNYVNSNNKREGHSNKSSKSCRNPPPRTATDRQPSAGGFEAKWDNYATAEGERADYWKTAEGYAERKAKMEAKDTAVIASGAEAETGPRFVTTFRQTGSETVNGKLGGVRKAVNVEEY
ncbi:hypothetical protein DOTSEDRAFT_19569 [Dothistroma septosporum NZE10]|uniref:Uncharacterized protein n=1 Tax=Dothistroma septosporum (strain NZE10 / CBS 128990) TaxID=675120 RepID=N1Q0A0_DOTSN|nr:hypothetical protein DOTSEDRAFT_19569 [Dothistroma septosporum NZE10]